MENKQYIPASKPHYALLDGLRGVAALMVIWYQKILSKSNKK